MILGEGPRLHRASYVLTGRLAPPYPFLMPSPQQGCLKADRSIPLCRSEALVVEARLDTGLGPLATVIVKRGRLNIGDPIVVGTEHGKVRSLRSSAGQGLASAGPGQHAVVVGLRSLPLAGDELAVVASDERARKISAARSARAEDFRRAQLVRAAAWRAAIVLGKMIKYTMRSLELIMSAGA